MNREQALSPSHLERLSVELLRIILCTLPDVATLHSAVLSCPTFHFAFQKAESSITTKVLLNQVDVDLLPDAVAALESWSLSQRIGHLDILGGRRDIQHFVTTNFHQRPKTPQDWTLQQAHRIGKLSDCVSQLADRFTSDTIARAPLSQWESAPTSQELRRIQRVLYRFEIYRNLFHESAQAQSGIVDQQYELFFESFTSWEIEQLGCIHDFLVRSVWPAFNEVAEHDIKWGMLRVEYWEKIDSPYTQHVLSLGLETIRSIITAKTYQDRYQLLESRGCPSRMFSFLYDGLMKVHSQREDSLPAQDPTLVESEQDPRPFYPELDSGPEDAWYWAHDDEDELGWVYDVQRQNLRQWGYVLWDKSRLEAVGLFESAWNDSDELVDASLEEQEEQRQRAYMQNSWDQREQVWSSGGHGWWSWGDESRVEWEQGRDPMRKQLGPGCYADLKPNSLEEARDMLAMMKLP